MFLIYSFPIINIGVSLIALLLAVEKSGFFECFQCEHTQLTHVPNLAQLVLLG